MPLVKVIRNGQITIPKVFRDQLGIEEGDLLEIQPARDGMLLKPKEIKDKKAAVDRFFRMVEQMRKSAKGADPKKIDLAIKEALRAARKAEH